MFVFIIFEMKINELGLSKVLKKCYQWVLVQPGIDRRPVNWCRNYMFLR